MSEAVVFSQTVEAFLGVVYQPLGEGGRNRLKETGIDPDRSLLPAYPAAVYVEALSVAAKLLYPGSAPAVGFFRIGHGVVLSFERSLIGKALFASARLLGARRMFLRISRNLRAGNNFTEASVTPCDDGTLEVLIDVVPEFRAAPGPMLDPHFMHGLFTAMVEVTGGSAADVRLLPGEAGSHRVRLIIRPPS